jgi:fatty acid desaturase
MPIHSLNCLLGTVLLVAGILAIIATGWPIWAVAVIIFVAGAPADEAIGDRDPRLSDTQRALYNANLYATLPLLVVMTLTMLWRVAVAFQSGIAQDFGADFAHGLEPRSELPDVVAAVFLTGYCYALFGATVGHELVHRTGVKLAAWSARALFAFTFNTAFPIFHIHGHHRQVGTLRDPATARRGEYILAFVLRTTFGQFTDALRFEADRARRRGHYPYGLGNRVLSGQVYSLVFVGVAGVIGGWPGVAAAVAAGLIGRFFHELVNYIQHYGLVRIDGASIEQRHAWDSHRFLSNVLQYNLPRHADHHMFASKPFWQLSDAAAAPVLPHGYQTMVFVALIPNLWRRMMQPRLADWDIRLANDMERSLIRERGWEGRC